MEEPLSSNILTRPGRKTFRPGHVKWNIKKE